MQNSRRRFILLFWFVCFNGVSYKWLSLAFDCNWFIFSKLVGQVSLIISHQYATFFVSSTHWKHHFSFYFQSMPFAFLNFVSQEFVYTMEARYRWRASRMMGEVVCFQNMLFEAWWSINFSSRLAESGLSSKTHFCCACNTFTGELLSKETFKYLGRHHITH